MTEVRMRPGEKLADGYIGESAAAMHRYIHYNDANRAVLGEIRAKILFRHKI